MDKITSLDEWTAEDHLNALRIYVDRTREIYYGKFPVLPDGFGWSCDVPVADHKLYFVSDRDDTTFFLDALLTEGVRDNLRAVDKLALADLVSTQIMVLDELRERYLQLQTLLLEEAQQNG